MTLPINYPIHRPFRFYFPFDVIWEDGDRYCKAEKEVFIVLN